jgi:pimeloyl-ACP methyl ester carboxylesterase
MGANAELHNGRCGRPSARGERRAEMDVDQVPAHAPGARESAALQRRHFSVARQASMIPSPPSTRASSPLASTSEALHIRAIGSLHIGGEEASIRGLPLREIVYSPGHGPLRIDPNGQFEVGQMYVQYVRLTRPRAPQPLLLMHGGGLCGVCYETTPDGRPGWQTRFLEHGHDVFVADAVERGRASWARSPEIFEGEPVFRTKAEAWELFRIGPPGSWRSRAADSAVCPGQRFPVEAFDRFMKQSMPRWSGNDARIQAAYDELLRTQGPFSLIAHSQGCNFAFRMALAQPDRVRALIALEPSGFPDPATQDLARLAGIPMLFVWGDHFATHTLWRQLRSGLEGFRDALRGQGVQVDELDLPSAGVHGNSHMLMMDRNSDEIAGQLQNWFTMRGLLG